MQFLIWTPDYSALSGGVTVLHYLAHELTKRGEKALLHARVSNPEWNNTLISTEEVKRLDMNETIVVYPEIVVGNPFEAKHVVRWILNTPGIMGGDGVYGPNDMAFLYQPYFEIKQKELVRGELQIFTNDLDQYYDRGMPRVADGVIFRKGASKERIYHDPAALVLDYVDRKMMPRVMAQLKTVISYDHVTYMSIQAALAGCLSIVIPDGVTPKDVWREKIPSLKYGVAYGLDDVEYALATQHLVRPHIEGLQAENGKKLDSFIEICRDQLRPSSSQK